MIRIIKVTDTRETISKNKVIRKNNFKRIIIGIKILIEIIIKIEILLINKLIIKIIITITLIRMNNIINLVKNINRIMIIMNRTNFLTYYLWLTFLMY